MINQTLFVQTYELEPTQHRDEQASGRSTPDCCTSTSEHVLCLLSVPQHATCARQGGRGSSRRMPHLPWLLKPQACQQGSTLLVAPLDPVVQHLCSQLGVWQQAGQQLEALGARQQGLHGRDLGHAGHTTGWTCVHTGTHHSHVSIGRAKERVCVCVCTCDKSRMP